MKSYFEDKRGILAIGSIVLVILGIFLVVEIVNGIKTSSTIGASASDTIVVTGHGEASSTPDTASFSFTVSQTGTTIAAAQNKANPIISKAIDYLKAQGVASNYIKTEGYDANPQYSYAPTICTPTSCGTNQTITGYQVSETVDVQVKDIDKAGSILGGVGALGISNISSLTFSISNEDALQRQARQEAIGKAKQQADELSQDLGVRLGKIVSFNENGSNPPVYYPKAMALGASASVASAPQVPTGENTITSDVTITYEIK